MANTSTRILGSCSICGGDVEIHVHPFLRDVEPPVTDHALGECRNCHARENKQAAMPIINMKVSRDFRHDRV